MTIEQEVLIALLKHGMNGSVSDKVINIDARSPSSVVHKLLRKMQKERLVYLRGSFVDVSQVQRLELASRAMAMGADIERLSRVLHWKEFEGMAAMALEQNGYHVYRNVRFRSEGRRWEIDVAGWKETVVICIDCKHWHRAINPSTLLEIVKDQEKRTKAFSSSMSKARLRLKYADSETAIFVPAVLSLVEGGLRFCNNVPVVPVLRLQDFLNQLPLHAHEVKHFQSPNSGAGFRF